MDGREFLAIFKSMDKTGALFVMDSLELIRTDYDSPDCNELRHDCYTPYLLNHSQSPKVWKFLGNIVIRREHIVKILIDHKANAFFAELSAKV